MNHCPSCESEAIWEEKFNQEIYRHCYRCSFCWKASREQSTILRFEAHDYAAHLDMAQEELKEESHDYI